MASPATCCQNATSAYIVPNTEVSMLIHIHTTANTPDLDTVSPIDEGRAAAQAEMYAPRAPGILINPRRRPIDGRLDSQKRMARRKSRSRRGYGGIHQTGQLWEGRQPPACLASDIFLDADAAGHAPLGARRLRGLLPDQTSFFIQHRIAVEGRQDDEPLRRRQGFVPVLGDARQIGRYSLRARWRICTATACHEQPTKHQHAHRDGEKPSSLHHALPWCVNVAPTA